MTDSTIERKLSNGIVPKRRRSTIFSTSDLKNKVSSRNKDELTTKILSFLRFVAKEEAGKVRDTERSEDRSASFGISRLGFITHHHPSERGGVKEETTTESIVRSSIEEESPVRDVLPPVRVHERYRKDEGTSDRASSQGAGKGASERSAEESPSLSLSRLSASSFSLRAFFFFVRRGVEQDGLERLDLRGRGRREATVGSRRVFVWEVAVDPTSFRFRIISCAFESDDGRERVSSRSNPASYLETPDF